MNYRHNIRSEASESHEYALVDGTSGRSNHPVQRQEAASATTGLLAMNMIVLHIGWYPESWSYLVNS